MISRRRFTTGVVIALTPLGSTASAQEYKAQQPGKIWRIGLFHVGLDHVPPSLDGLREGLTALGYEEGKNIHFDWRNLPDEDAARTTAQAFVRDRVDLIVAFENQTVRAIRATTTEIPVVMLHVPDSSRGRLRQESGSPRREHHRVCWARQFKQVRCDIDSRWVRCRVWHSTGRVIANAAVLACATCDETPDFQ